MEREFWIDNFNMDTIDYFFVRGIDVTPIPRETLQSDRGGDDGAVVSSQYMRTRKIIARCEIVAPGYVPGQIAHDNVIERLYGTNKLLSFIYAGDDRHFTGTPSEPVESEWIGGFKRMSLIFDCHDPFGYSPNYTTSSVSAQTASSISTSPSWNGTYSALPIITIDINSLTVSNPGTITVQSGSGTVAITRTWTAGELLIVNSETGKITVDGVEVPYSGILPRFTETQKSTTYTDNFTARNIDLEVKYKARYV
jgi:phage-related protein